MWKLVQRMTVELLRKRLAECKDDEERKRLSRRLARQEAKLLKNSDKRDPDPPELG